MPPRLSGQTSLFGGIFFVSKSVLAISKQKIKILTRKPRSHVRILIYRTWAVTLQVMDGHSFALLVTCCRHLSLSLVQIPMYMLFIFLQSYCSVILLASVCCSFLQKLTGSKKAKKKKPGPAKTVSTKRVSS